MAESRDITFKSLGVTLKDVPYSAPEEEVRAAAQRAVQMQQTVPTPGPIPWEQASTEKPITGEQRQQQEQAAVQDAPPLFSRERISGAWDEAMGASKEILDSVTRGAAPAATGAAFGGAVAGPAGAAVGAMSIPVADAVVSGVNALFGTEWSTPSQAIKDWLQKKMGIEPSDSLVNQTLELATQAVTGSYATSGVAGTIANAPSAGNMINTRGVPSVLRGPTGAPAAPTAGNNIAAQFANAPNANAISAIPGTFVGEGSSQLMQSAGVAPEWADAIAIVPGLLADIGFGAAADNLAMRSSAQSAPVPENVQRQIDLTDRATGGRDPLTTDEMLMLNRPTQQEGAGTAARMGSTQSGVDDTFTRRVNSQTDRIMNFMAEEGVELTEYGNVAALQKDHLAKILDSHNITRSEQLRYFTDMRDQVIEGLSNPDMPVPINRTASAIDGIKEELLGQNAREFMSLGQELDNLKANLEQGMPLNKVYAEMRRIRNSLGDEQIPKGVRGERDKVMREVMQTLRSDIDDFIVDNAGPESVEFLNEANRGLRNLTEDLDDEFITDALNQAGRMEGRETVETIRNFVDPNVPMNEATQFYDELDPYGQRLIQQSIYGDILRKSMVDGKPSPTAFNAATAEYEQWLNVIRDNTKDLTVDEGRFGIIVERDVPFDPQPLDDLNEINEFTREVVSLAEQLSKEGPAGARRMSLGESPTAGIALSQLVRRLGIGASLFIGDVMSGSFGTIARRFQRPEVRDMMASLRTMTPGSEAYLEGAKRLLRTLYIDELRGQEAPTSGGPMSAEARTPTTPTGGGVGTAPTTLRGRPEESR